MPTPLAAAAVDTTGAIRRFTDSGILASVNKALEALPPEKHIAVIAEANMKAAQGMVVYKINGEWSVVGALRKTYDTRGVDGQVAAVWSK